LIGEYIYECIGVDVYIHIKRRKRKNRGWYCFQGDFDQKKIKMSAIGHTQAPQAVKKLVIKPLKARSLPADFEQQQWGKLRDAIKAVQSAQPVATSLEELYRAVEDMCLHKLAPRLYDLLYAELDSHAASTATTLAEWTATSGHHFLTKLSSTWKQYCEQTLLTRQIFLYLDRTHILTSNNTLSGTRSIYDLGLTLFRSHIAQRPDIEHVAIKGILSLIGSERQGEAIDRQLARDIVDMFASLGIYEGQLQQPVLDASIRHYTAEGQTLTVSLEVPAYLVHVEKRLEEEHDRCDTYLKPVTRKALVGATETCLLLQHVASLLERGLEPLIDAAADAEHTTAEETRYDDLARMYRLCGRIKALEALKASFKSYIRKAGSALVLDEEKDAEMIRSLLQLKSMLDGIIKGPFQGNLSFNTALKDAFEHFINQRANRPAELLAKHLDAVMRGSLHKGIMSSKAEDEIEPSIDAALVLFRFIQGKDTFEAFYKKDLARRLLLNRSVSIDAEKMCISKLKAECGSQFTNKLEGMFKDVDLSHDVMNAFKSGTTATAATTTTTTTNAQLASVAPGLDMSVHVLTSGFWPTYPILECTLPDELAAAQKVFMDFYLSKHQGRRLVWHNSLGTCVIKAKFDGGAKELSVSLFQAAVLSLFNDTDTMSFKDIATATKLEDKELRRTLQSLACGRERVLLKSPKGKDVEDDDVFSFNNDYTSRLYRVKINTIQLKETPEEQKKTNDAVLQDRQYQIDAAIVRIMKTRKTLSHKLLVNELMIQLKFPLQSSDLKKRIESLIDREYLERDAESKDIYIYLA
jgi:cullin-4